ncbi:PTS sugar transporter subunit IIA, partial [Intestinibacter sp.]|uniref:PTS sugar transporter subunit IIA n=1 Tax=Intestinibacter sp. TaxID=1965304 RepID=UPI003F17A064
KNKKVLMKKIEGILKNIQTEEELIDIKNKLASVIVEDNSLKSLLSKDHIRITKDRLNWEESMIMSGEILVQEKIIYEEYLKKAVSNVKEWGPYIILTKGIALVHASKEQGVNDEAISLLVSSKGVMFEGETEPVYLLFCFCTEGEIDYMDLFKELIALGKNEDKKLKIINSNTIDEIYEAIFS